MAETASIPLTCYIRTLNEAARIGPVVEKAVAIGAEVIIVDSGSTADTREITCIYDEVKNRPSYIVRDKSTSNELHP